jgi:hypothetical protein
MFFNSVTNTLELWNGSAWVQLAQKAAVSCKAIYDAGGRTNGNYELLPPGSSNPVVTYCDLNSHGGGWTEVYRHTLDNTEGTNIGWYGGVSGPGSLIATSTEMMFAYINVSTGALANAWKFPTPAAFHSVSPLAGNQCSYVTISATRLADNTTSSRMMRYGHGSFGTNCDEGCSGTFGQICLKSNTTQGSVGGFSDFPHFSGWSNLSHPEYCAASNQAWNGTICDASRRFVVFVR